MSACETLTGPLVPARTRTGRVRADPVRRPGRPWCASANAPADRGRSHGFPRPWRIESFAPASPERRNAPGRLSRVGGFRHVLSFGPRLVTRSPPAVPDPFAGSRDILSGSGAPGRTRTPNLLIRSQFFWRLGLFSLDHSILHFYHYISLLHSILVFVASFCISRYSVSVVTSW